MSITMGLTITFIVFLIMLLGGVHIHGVLLGTGLVGLILLGHGSLLAHFMGYQSYPAVASYTLSTIPMFILCAQFILMSGMVEDLYNSIYNFSKGRKGMLGTVTLIIGAFLGAVCGSGIATSSALAQVAYPQLHKHGYNPNLAAAISAAAGSLSSIIPPSTVIIVYGVVTETPIGKLFIAAILPGIAVTSVYIICNYVFLKLDKSHTEQHAFEKIPMERRKGIISLVFGVIIAITIFGGIYSGFTTPTEAGALAAFIALLAAAALGKVNGKFLYNAGLETLKVTAMIMVILIGAKIFGKFMSMSMLARKFIALLDPLIPYPALIIAIIIALYFVLFMFVEGTAVILMTTPFLIPLMITMEIDTLWFGILVCLCCVLGMLTPPVGMCVYAVAGITKLPIEGIFKYGIIMAAAASVIVGGLMIVAPEIATFLPNSMR